MNCCFYLAIDRLPLATVAAIEFLPVVVLAQLPTAVEIAGVGLVIAGVAVHRDAGGEQPGATSPT